MAGVLRDIVEQLHLIQRNFLVDQINSYRAHQGEVKENKKELRSVLISIVVLQDFECLDLGRIFSDLFLLAELAELLKLDIFKKVFLNSIIVGASL